MKKNKIITRFAPSSTGFMHIGSIKAAILPYLFSKKNVGNFFLRIDNTDLNRSKEYYEDHIKKTLEILQIKPDFVIRQCERLDIYNKYFNSLKQNKEVYECFETEEDLLMFQKYKKKSQKPTIFNEKSRFITEGKESYWRFKLKEKNKVFQDGIFGEMNQSLSYSDPVIKRSDGSFTYVFTSVVDDIVENVSHIIRGSEHISNVFVQEQIGSRILGEDWNINWIHYPLFKDAQGGKVSKRNNQKNDNIIYPYEPISFFSLLTNLGTSKKQCFSTQIEDYVDYFDIKDFAKCPIFFQWKMMDTTNSFILRNLTEDEVISRGGDLDFWKILKNNINSWEEFLDLTSHIKSLDIKSIRDTFNNCSRDKMFDFYEKVMKKRSGPPVKDLLDFLNQYIKDNNL